MGGPSTHGQRNKAHKSGNKGASARQKHRQAKEGERVVPKGGSARDGGRQERLLAAKQHRDAKRAQLLDKRRRASTAPLVVALLPLSQDVDVLGLWSNLLAACGQPQLAAESAHGVARAGADVAMADEHAGSTPTGLPAAPLRACTVAVAGRGKLRLTLLPPPADRRSPLAILDVAKAAEVVLLAVPGDEATSAIDAEGTLALTMLRTLGLPEVVVVTHQAVKPSVSGAGATINMKARAVARKRAAKAVSTALAGEQRVFITDTQADAGQLVRHLAERPAPALPAWRQLRPSLMVEAAVAGAPSTDGLCELHITGCVRGAGLSANQLVTVPGAGDFQILRITQPAAAQVVVGTDGHAGKALVNGHNGEMDIMKEEPIILAQADPELAEPVLRENDGGGSGGDQEQTWPTAAEIDLFARRRIRRRLPEGTSEYQAAWLVDDEDGSEEEGEDDDGSGDEHMGAAVPLSGGGDGGSSAGDAELEDPENETGTDGMALDEEGGEEDAEGGPGDRWQRMQAEARARREAEGQDATYPDEVDVPPGVAARVRFQKYRGLKSFRSSAWDVKEWLPQEYARVFAFQNFKRAQKRAKQAVERATSGGDPCAVEPGAWVTVTLQAVPVARAAAVVQRVAASAAPAPVHQPPLVCFGLLAHESKMSVVHFGVTKASTYTEPLRNKEQLLLVTGLRSFRARPVLSADTPGDKQKMERWLRPGQAAIASVYAPIAYPPLPLLAFKEDEAGGVPQLAAVGSLRTCNPDRVVLKKIVLTGYPVRVHKRRATVKYMFHQPDDVRWFKPIELHTRAGRRGRITEPLGTHGAMKALFDGPVQQREVVCMNLYKRVFPKWPEDGDLTFA